MSIKTITMLIILTGLASCGTAKGVWDGAGAVLNGVAEDVKDIGDVLL